VGKGTDKSRARMGMEHIITRRLDKSAFVGGKSYGMKVHNTGSSTEKRSGDRGKGWEVKAETADGGRQGGLDFESGWGEMGHGKQEGILKEEARIVSTITEPRVRKYQKEHKKKETQKRSEAPMD